MVGKWRMPETNPNTCSLVDPNVPIKGSPSKDSSLSPLYIGLTALGILLALVFIIVVVVLFIKRKGWKSAPTVV